MIPGLMLAFFCGVMALNPLRGTVEEPEVKDPIEQVKVLENEYILDNPQSERYKIGDINWKQVGEINK